MADNLDDEWWLQDQIKGDNDKTVNESSLSSKKRSAADAVVDTGSTSEDEQTVNTQETSRKKKRKESKKPKNITEFLSTQNPQPLQPNDLISVLTSHYSKQLSVVEMDELTLNTEHFAACNDMTHTPISYLKFLVPHWKRTVKNFGTNAGCPVVLIVCSSGLRSVHFIREIAELKTAGCKIAKLFAKHIKITEQVQFLQKTTVHIAVGTPNRIAQLLSHGSLQLSAAKYVVIDWSYRDLKQRRLIDMPEIRTDLMHLLHDHIVPFIRSTNHCKLALL